MEVRTESRRGWRRSLAALAIVAAPVASVAGFANMASAGAPIPGFDSEATAAADCDNVAGAGITVTIDDDGGSARYEILINSVSVASNLNPDSPSTYHYVRTDGTYTVRINQTNTGSLQSWQGTITVDCSPDPEDSFSAVPACEGGVPGITVTVPDVKPGNGPRNDIFVDGTEVESAVADGTPVFIPLSAGTYDVSVEVTGTPIGTTQEVTVSAYVCVGDPEDGVVSEVCSGEYSPGLNINIPDEKSGNGPKYTLYISPDGEDVDTDTDEADSNFGDGYDVSYNTGEGTFHIMVVGPADDELYNDYFTVDCSNGGGGNDGWTINLDFLKPRTLPTTGSNTNSLLMVAPLMVMLGAGLILARRRSATV